MAFETKKSALFLRAGIVGLVLLLLSFQADAQPLKMRNILVLHSYHQGLEWTDNISAGIQSVLKTSDSDGDIEIYYEYLDTKKNPSQAYFNHLINQFQSYKTNLTNIDFEVIMTADNDALRFMVEYGDQLFPGVPVVFCGVNNFKPEMLKGKLNFTGVVENVDYEATLNIMKKLHPDKSRVLVILDQTSTGIAIKDELDKITPKFSDQFEFEYFQDFVLNEIEPKISELNNDYLIYILAFNKDRDNNFISYTDIIRKIHRAAGVPIYGSWDFFFGKGIMGGMITSGFSQGEQAATLAQKILNGESVAQIPIIDQSPNKYMFDDAELIRFGIKKSQLPPNSYIINEPPGFFDQHKEVLIIFSAITFGISLYLIWRSITQKHKQITLEKDNQELDRRVKLQTTELQQKNLLLKQEILERQQAEIVLQDKTDKLQQALSEVKVLSGLLPICSNCKKIRDDKGYWSQLEIYIAEHTEANFTHGICPECFAKLYPDYKHIVGKK